MRLENNPDAAAQALLLIDLLVNQGVPHRQMLAALLTAFVGVAATHECCREVAARAALTAGGRLLVDPIFGAAASATAH